MTESNEQQFTREEAIARIRELIECGVIYDRGYDKGEIEYKGGIEFASAGIVIPNGIDGKGTTGAQIGLPNIRTHGLFPGAELDIYLRSHENGDRAHFSADNNDPVSPRYIPIGAKERYDAVKKAFLALVPSAKVDDWEQQLHLENEAAGIAAGILFENGIPFEGDDAFIAGKAAKDKYPGKAKVTPRPQGGKGVE